MVRALPYLQPERLALLTDAQDPENGGFMLRDLELLRSYKHSFREPRSSLLDAAPILGRKVSLPRMSLNNPIEFRGV